MAPKGGRLGPGKAFLTAYVERSVVERLDAVAAAQDLSRSKLIERLVIDGLQDMELEVRALTDPVVGPAIINAFARPEVLRAMANVLRQDLSDDQLQLFQQAMHATSDQLNHMHAKRRPSAKRTPRAGNSRKGKKP